MLPPLSVWCRCLVRAYRPSALRMAKAKPSATAEETDTDAVDEADVDNVQTELAPVGSTVNGINIFKTGQDPVILPDDQYPEWLWELTKPRPTLAELNHKFEHDRDNLSLKDWHYMIRLENRARVKEHNMNKATSK